MISDEELKQAYQVFLDDDGIINLILLKAVREPESSTCLARLIRNDVMTILDGDPTREFDMLVDLFPAGKGGRTSSKARKIYAEISTHAQTRKFAIVGGSALARTTAKFLIHAAGKGRSMKWFTSKEEALAWLKEGG